MVGLSAQYAKSSFSRAILYQDLHPSKRVIVTPLPHNGDYSGVDGVVDTRYISKSLTPSLSAMMLATPNQTTSYRSMGAPIGFLAMIPTH
jgi:hypothetical protein